MTADDVLKAAFWIGESCPEARQLRPLITRASWTLVLLFSIIALFIVPSGLPVSFYSQHPRLFIFNLLSALLFLYLSRAAILVLATRSSPKLNVSTVDLIFLFLVMILSTLGFLFAVLWNSAFFALEALAGVSIVLFWIAKGGKHPLVIATINMGLALVGLLVVARSGETYASLFPLISAVSGGVLYGRFAGDDRGSAA
jgi:hypothetical protein